MTSTYYKGGANTENSPQNFSYRDQVWYYGIGNLGLPLSAASNYEFIQTGVIIELTSNFTDTQTASKASAKAILDYYYTGVYNQSQI